MRRWLVALLVLSASLAGCIGSEEDPRPSDDAVPVGSGADPEPDHQDPETTAPEPQRNGTEDPVPDEPRIPPGYRYTCPSGEAETRADGLCTGTIASMTNASVEPYVAQHPTQPSVVAIGVNAYHTVTAANTAGSEPGIEVLRVDILVTEDGGESWQRVRHPFVERPGVHLGSTESGDPALAFDREGVLHLSALVLEPGLSGIRVFYTATPDLGRTWTEPVLLTEETNSDRNWITVDPGGERIYVPWQHTLEDEAAVSLAWSRDGGLSWTRASYTGCTTASPVVLTPEPVVACARTSEEGTTGVQVLTLEDGELVPRASIDQPGAVWPLLARSPDGSVHVVTESGDVQRMWYAQSLDGGRTWTDPIDLRDALTVEDGWENARSYWATTDPWGALHLIVSSESSTVVNAPAGPTARPVAHAVLDPSNLTVIQERMLSTDDPAEQLRLPPAPPVALSTDHYYGLDFSGETGVLAWVRNNGVDYTLVEPER